MKHCVVIPDSFKGSMDSLEICSIIKEKILEYEPACKVSCIPVADGGEGTADCFLHALSAQKVTLSSTGPFGEPIECYYARFQNTAVIELAQCAGLPLAEGRLNPGKATTYGVGTMIRHAVEHGCTEIVIGLGGSATNDGGVGMAAALGTIFYDQNQTPFLPTGDTLAQITKIDCNECQKLLSGCQITAMCDIDNPMYGEQGAAAVFAPQKGADASMVHLLDENLRALDQSIQRNLHKQVADLPGAGAAGAAGAGVVAFLNGNLKSGIQTVLDLVNFESICQDADLILTGEGKIDGQSLRGKVVIGVSERAKKLHIPVIAIVGDIGEDAEGAYEHGVSAIISINRVAVPFSQARQRSKTDLRDTVDTLMKIFKIHSKMK
jgi:glycerate kinase